MTTEEKIIELKSIRKKIKDKKKSLEFAISKQDKAKQETIEKAIKKLKARLKSLSEDKNIEKKEGLNKLDITIESLKNENKKIKDEKKKSEQVLLKLKDSEEFKKKSDELASKMKDRENALKDQIYNTAFKVSGLDLNSEEKSPDILIARYLEDLNKLKKEIEIEKKRIEEYSKRRQVEMVSAVIKYNQRLVDKKMTLAEFNKMVETNNQKYTSDIDRMEKPLRNVERELENKREDLKVIEGKANIYNKYAKLFKEEFEESMESYISNIENKSKQTKIEKEIVEVKKVERIIKQIEDKETFDNLYKRLKDGYILDDEKLILYNAMKYKSKYKQFDITTGVIYNKAARILKEEYSDVQEQIDNYMNNCKEVLPEISKFKKNKVFFSKGSKLIDKVKNIANNIYSNIGEELDIERVNLVEEFEIDEEQENYDLREIKENIEMFKEGYRIYLEIQAEKSEGKMVKSFRDRIKGWLLKDEFALPESKDK